MYYIQFFAGLKSFYRLHSTQIMALLTGLSLIEGYFHAFSVFLPDGWLPYITALFAFAALLARFLPQPAAVEIMRNDVAVAEVKKTLDDQNDVH